MSVPVVIVGGGVSGLAAAYELSRRRIPFTLLEASSRLGGIIRTDAAGEFVIDAGPDAFLVTKPGAIELCRELGIADRLVSATPPRRAFVVRGGRLHPIPDRTVLGVPTDPDALARSTLFFADERARIVRECRMGPDPADEGADESIGSFFRRRFGEAAAEYLAEPLLAGIHTGDVDRLSMAALFPRLVRAAATGSVSRAMAGEAVATEPEGPFRSFPEGLQVLVNALVDRLRGDLRTDCPVTRIEREPAGFALRLESAESISARAVILAVPAYVAASLFTGLDPALADACASTRYVSSGIVVLAYPRNAVEHPLEGSGFVVPRAERDVEILAATWLSSKWPGRAPEDTALMRAFFGGARRPESLARPDDEIAARAHQDLARLLGIRGEPRFVRVYRWTKATVQYEVGQRARFAELQKRLASYPGLFVTGPAFGGIGIPECISAARAVARAI